MTRSLLEEELEILKAQIEQTRAKSEGLEAELRAVEGELAAFSGDRERFDALRRVCDALERLEELDAGELFWEGAPKVGDTAAHIQGLRERIVLFEGEIQGREETKKALKGQIQNCLYDLDDLQEEVRQAYAREERRQEEFVLEREVSDLPYRRMVMPWSKEGEDEKRFRRAILVALLLSIVFGYGTAIWQLPAPDPSVVIEIPERLVTLVKKEPPKPEPPPERPKEEKKPDAEQEKAKEAVAKETPKPTTPEAQVARKKAESTGVLAFKNSFADLMDETPIARLGAEARLSKEAPRAAGQAQAQRSLVAMQAQGGSGGIGAATVSRNVGSGGKGNADRIGGVGFARVESAVAGLAAEAGRPVSDGVGPSRTDEEIQIVFDRYKATLYRLYNTELRKNPTLRGKMLLKITIEGDGAVSQCTVESTDLASPELVAQILDRVKRFNFGPKDGVPKTTILYPIDFLPAG